MRRFKRAALTVFVVAGYVTIIGAGAEIERAQAADAASQAKGTAAAPAGAPPVNPPSSPPSPNFNSSGPNTTPQSNETPVSPQTPGTGPGSH
jgi:hypothetical protein